LGFSIIGIKVEKPHLWRKAIYELNLASKTYPAFANIFMYGKQVYYYFYTPFLDGHTVLTANGIFPAITSDKLLQSVVAVTGVENLLAIHTKQIEQFVSKDFRPYEIFDQESRIKATYNY
jgi:hypothetical protein